ncbi:MAG: APC family permease [Chloroflexia bacterium]
MATTTTSSTVGRGFRRVLKALDITLFTVCAILVLDTLAPAAAIGPAGISWWVITLVLFFIPYGLITAELATTYPQQGGLYVWIYRAFGERWAARATWLYWVNVALGMPSIYILFAGMCAQMFFPALELWAQIGIGIALTWATVWIGIVALQVGKWVPNLGAMLKAGIMLVLGVGSFFYAARNGVANDLSLRNILPTWDAGLFFLPVIVFSFMGFEVSSSAAEEMTNPKRDVPRAIVVSGLLIALFYVAGTVGMLVALPLEDLGLIEGIVDTLRAIFGDSGTGGALVTALGIAALYTLFATMVTWTMAANRSAAEAAAEGVLPAIFARLHPTHRTPVGGLFLTGLVSTGELLLYGLVSRTSEQLFWTLYAFATIVFLLPYLALFPAFLLLRWKDRDAQRPYQVPGGTAVAVALALLGEIFMLQAVVFFVWVPGQPIDISFALPIVLGVAATWIVGEVLLEAARRRESPVAPWWWALLLLLPPAGLVGFAAVRGIPQRQRLSALGLGLLWCALLVAGAILWPRIAAGALGGATP